MNGIVCLFHAASGCMKFCSFRFCFIICFRLNGQWFWKFKQFNSLIFILVDRFYKSLNTQHIQWNEMKRWCVGMIMYVCTAHQNVRISGRLAKWIYISTFNCCAHNDDCLAFNFDNGSFFLFDFSFYLFYFWWKSPAFV